jgi:uncharacterized protein YgiM (DUF1202 family)
MPTNQGRLFPVQEEATNEVAIAPKEKVPAKEKMVRKPIPEPVAVEKTATCNVNIRKQPSLSSFIIRVLKEGEKIKILEEQGEWSKTFEGYYIMSQYLH